jgi:peptidoglycan/xylan/chitin deacetylase (PgdA/CDA1 family)
MLRSLSVALLVACNAAPGGGPTGPGGTAPDVRTPDSRPQGMSNVIVSLTFDDTLEDQFQVGAMLAARNMHATFFINSSRIGFSSYMTLAQVEQLRDAGNELGGHTIDHLYLTQLDAENLRHQVCDDRSALTALGLNVTAFAYPFGDENTAVEQVVHDCGYMVARSIGGLYTTDSCASCPYANTMPPANLYDVRTMPSVAGATTADSLEAYVIAAEQHGGGWVPYVFHHVCDACSAAQVRPTVLAEFLDRLQARGARVVTVSNVVGGGM